MPTQHAPQRSSIVLSMPVSGTENVYLEKGKELALTFNPSDMVFTRDGSTLVISEWEGGRIAILDFFAGKTDELPVLLLPDGDSVNSADFLSSRKIDISMAAGSTDAPPESGGEGAYSDAAGSLLNGVDRLGSLGTDAWDRSTESADRELGPGSSFSAKTVPAPDIPAGQVTPPPPDISTIEFSARAVLYMHNEGTGPGRTSYLGRSVTARGLADNAGQWEVAGQPARSIEAHPENTLNVDELIQYLEDGFGNITFSLTAAGRQWMQDHPGEDIPAYYVITDAGGASYVMQVLISADERFDSGDPDAAHNALLDPAGLIYGEWHGGTHDTATGYQVTSSRLGDELTFTGNLAGADVAVREGSDTIDVYGEMSASRVYLGNRGGGVDTDASQAGDVNKLFVGGNITTSRIYGTEGTDLVTAGTAAAPVVVDDTLINTGAGHNDHVAINGRMGLTDAGGLLGGSSANAVTAVDGVVDVHSRGGAYAVLAQTANRLNMGAAAATNEITAREIHVTAEGGTGNNYALYAQSKNTADTVYNKLTADTVEVAASGANAAGLWADGYSGRVTQGYNEITADTLRVTTQSAGNNFGLEALKGAENRLHGKADGSTLEISSTGGGNHAMHALSEGKNLVDGFSEVEIIAGRDGNPNSYAMFASTNGENRITGRDADAVIQLTSTGDAVALGMRTDPGGRNILEQAGTIDVTARSANGGAQAMSANGGGAGVQNTIQDAGVVNLSAFAGTHAAGIWAGTEGGQPATTTDAANLITGLEAVNITVKGQTTGVGMQTAGAYTNTIAAVSGAIEMTVTDAAKNYGLSASRAGAASGGKNSIEGANNLTVVVSGAAAVENTALRAESKGTNSISDIAGVANILAHGGSDGNTGLSAVGEGLNTIANIGEIVVTAAGPAGSVNKALNAQGGGTNSLNNIAEKTTLTAADGDTNYGLYADTGSLNRIEHAENIHISALNGTDNYGMYVNGSGTNEAGGTGAGSLAVTASGGSGTNIAMYAAWDGGVGRATNIVSDADEAALTASGGAVNYGMRAESGGRNTIAGNRLVEVGAVGGAGSTNVGMSSVDNSGNMITNSDTVEIVLSNRTSSTNTGMEASRSDAETSFSGNSITNTTGDVLVSVQGGTSAVGMAARSSSGMAAQNLIKEAGSVIVIAGLSVTQVAMLAEGDGALNRIQDISGHVLISASGALPPPNAKPLSSTAMSASDYGVNEIVSAATVTVNALSATVNRAMYAVGGGKNRITAGDAVSLQASSTAGSYAMYADGGYNSVTVTNADAARVKIDGHVVSTGNGINSIVTKDGDDLVTIAGQAKGVRTGTPGNYTCSNTISTGEGNDTVAVTGGNSQIVALHVDLGEGDNLFVGGTAAGTLTALTPKLPSFDPKTWAGSSNQFQDCAIESGDGADTLLFHGDLRSETYVSSGGGDDLIAVKGTVGHSFIDAGEGDNSITIIGAATKARITAGGGNDALTIDSTGAGSGIGGTFFDLGDGDNTVSLTAASGVDALGGGSALNTGSGADRITLTGNVGGFGSLYGESASTATTIATGAGNDYLVIDGTMSSASGLKLDMGEGRDTLALKAANWGELSTRYEAWLTGGGLTGASVEVLEIYSDSDVIPGWLQGVVDADSGLSLELHASLSSLSSTAYAAAGATYYYEDSTAVLDHNVIFGAGDDRIGVGSIGNGLHLDLGGGSNALHVADGIGTSTVLFADGADTAVVGGLQGTDMHMGEGDDSLFLNGNADGATVNMEDGDDLLMIRGGNVTGSTLDGGANGAPVHAAADGETSHVGDILGFSGEALHNLDTILGSGSGNIFKGFESLLADLSGGTADTLALSALIDAARSLTGLNSIETLIVKGDADDTLNLGNYTAVAEAHDVRIDGLEGSYTLYAVDAEGEQLQFYLQNIVQMG